MNGLILFLGGSFRLGNQWNINIGSNESYHEQINACKRHVEFIEHIIKKYQLNSISVFISTYNTQFNNDLLSIYEKYLIGSDIYDNLIGINNLFHNSINKIKNIEKFDFVLFIRIDLFLKDYFLDIFNPNINMVLFPTICWKQGSIYNNHPRVNDVIIFIPKKYYKYIRNIFNITHTSWHDLIEYTDLKYDDIDVMINTFHDSDSYKDFNPLYTIINREESKIWLSEGHTFDKYNFN
jgi:hypothetical protein